MPVYVNEWQNKVKQDSCTDKTVKRQDADIYVNEWQNKVKQDSCTDILPFIYIYRHTVS
jgi:heme oxygenase